MKEGAVEIAVVAIHCGRSSKLNLSIKGGWRRRGYVTVSNAGNPHVPGIRRGPRLGPRNERVIHSFIRVLEFARSPISA
ncbi:hypothetical protein MTP99_002573 [Tenebrio molitor]|nr:hypothetical protein MTP99_002573 [Tenebrio molitor]